MTRLLTLPFELLFRILHLIFRLIFVFLRQLARFLAYAATHLSRLLEHIFRITLHLVRELGHLGLEIVKKVVEIVTKTAEFIFKLPLEGARLVTKFILGVFKSIGLVAEKIAHLGQSGIVLLSSRSVRMAAVLVRGVGRALLALVKIPLGLLVRLLLIIRRSLVALNLVDDIVLLPTMPFFRLHRKKRR